MKKSKVFLLGLLAVLLVFGLVLTGCRGGSSRVSLQQDNIADSGIIYVAGAVGTGANARATLWRNGQQQTLSNTRSWAFSVFVSGGNVYVAGRAVTGANDRATLWRNGRPQTLSNTQSVASSVFVSGRNVYVAGNTGTGANMRATLWRNGRPQTLSDT